MWEQAGYFHLMILNLLLDMSSDGSLLADTEQFLKDTLVLDKLFGGHRA